MPRFLFSFPEAEREQKVAAGNAVACPEEDHSVSRVWWVEDGQVHYEVVGCDMALREIADAIPATAQERADLEALLGG